MLVVNVVPQDAQEMYRDKEQGERLTRKPKMVYSDTHGKPATAAFINGHNKNVTV